MHIYTRYKCIYIYMYICSFMNEWMCINMYLDMCVNVYTYLVDVLEIRVRINE